jgi:hypothetical protein
MFFIMVVFEEDVEGDAVVENPVTLMEGKG